MTNTLFERVHSVSIYVPDLASVLDLYFALGLEPYGTYSMQPNDGRCSQIALRFSGGGPFLLLHDDADRQFVDVAVLMEDLARAYALLSRQPRLNWLATPTREEGSGRAVVRLPDGNLFTMVDDPSSLSPERSR